MALAKTREQLLESPISNMGQPIEPLAPPDSFHLSAAVGWLELGNHGEANDELERIAPAFRIHPDVLKVRYEVYAKAGKWEIAADIAQAITKAVPDVSYGWFHLAYALHELKRTQEAWNVLLPVADKFPDLYLIRYNLACYACQLGNLEEAMQWLDKAFDIADKKSVKLMALKDPDLEPLWGEIARI